MSRHAKASFDGSLRGRELEDLVEQRLQHLVKNGFLLSYRRHTNNEPEDRAGYDFTISVQTPIGEKVVGFGVTISSQRHARHRSKRPRVIQFHFPVGTGVYAIDKKILQLASRL